MLPPIAQFPSPSCPGAGDRPGGKGKSWKSALPEGRTARKEPLPAAQLCSAPRLCIRSGQGAPMEGRKARELTLLLPPFPHLCPAHCPLPLCREGQRASHLAPLPGAGAFCPAARWLWGIRQILWHPQELPGHSTFAPGGGWRPRSPRARPPVREQAHPSPLQQDVFDQRSPVQWRKGDRAERPPARAPSPVPGPLSPTRPAAGAKKRPPGSFAGQALLSHLWYLMLPPMQKAR